ncbi:MAG: AAA family ATPase, partial [Pseudobdellovibrionaceae bacterium]|nr:AAA family ATPase [Pseudobdellovibrionaceae bacterium]
SRDLDPQLHSHCVVPNVAMREDGKWCSPNLKQLFREKLTIGAMYRAELAQGMRALGFQIEEDRQFFRVQGVPKELETELSKRRQQITERMLREGVEGAKQASRVSLLTRPEKRLVEERTLFTAWQDIAAEHGLTAERVSGIRDEGVARLAIDEKTRTELIGKTLKELSQGMSTFTEQQAKAKFAEKAQTLMTSDQIRDAFKDLFGSTELLKLTRDREGQMRYTTTELRQVEERVIQTAFKLSKVPDFGIEKPEIEKRLKAFEDERSRLAGKTVRLSEDQRQAAAHALGPGRVKVVAGMAGAGKTFSMEAVARALEKDGYQVSGMAPTGIAAAKLSEAGIPTQTIDKYLLMRSKGAPSLTSKDVVIVDEAGMIGSRKMDRLLQEIEKSGAKAILLGEAEQLQPVEAGGMFRAVSETIGKAGLTTIVRQETLWQRQAVKHFRAGEAKEALKLYQDAGRLSVHDNGQVLVENMVKEHVRLATEKSDRPRQVVALSKTNAVVDELNHGIREELKAQGILPRTGGAEVEVKYGHYAERQKIELAAGDKVVFLRNDKKLGVQNGLFAEVKGFKKDARGQVMSVQFRDERGTDHSIDVSKYPHIRHAYAITGYKSQGSTFSHVLVHATPELSREETYVKMSRQKVDAKLFVSREAFDVKFSELSPDFREQTKKPAGQELAEEIPVKKFRQEQTMSPLQEKGPTAQDKAAKAKEKTLEEKLGDALSRSQAKDVSTSYKVTQGQVHRTERLEKLAKELPRLQGEKRLQALAEVATSLGGVATKYESAPLSPPWQEKAREILEKRSFEQIPDLAKQIMSHPKGRESIQTTKERQHVESLRTSLKPTLDGAIKIEKSLSLSRGKGIER